MSLNTAIRIIPMLVCGIPPYNYGCVQKSELYTPDRHLGGGTPEYKLKSESRTRNTHTFRPCERYPEVCDSCRAYWAAEGLQPDCEDDRYD